MDVAGRVKRESPLSLRWDPTVARPLLAAVTDLTGETTAQLLQRLVLEELLRLRREEHDASAS